MNYKKSIKIISAFTAAVLGTVSLTACSIPGLSKPEPSSAPTADVETINTPEQAIIGTWMVDSIVDKDGNEVSISDVDLSGTPLNDMSGLIGMVLKQGVKLEFKADNTVSLSIFSGNYQISDETLEISVPQISQSFKLPCSIQNDTLTVKINSYSAILSKK